MKLYISRSNILDQIAVITIGFPFASFKVLLGITFPEMLSLSINYIVGAILIGWSIIDFLINGINLLMLLFKNCYLPDVCLLTSIFASKNLSIENNHLAWKELGTALDVMLSFFLVAIMVGGNLFRYLSHWEMNLWSVSVVVNVLGAGITRIFLSIQQVKDVHAG